MLISHRRTKIRLIPKAARSWIEANFQKRECIKFVPSPKDDNRCYCGLSFTFHRGTGLDVDSYKAAEQQQWTPSRHTQPSPTDAYGTIEFQGGPHPSKAQYVRLAYDTRPELILQLFTREWNLELPKLLITVQGGKANFDLQPKLKKVLRKGLLKAAKTTGAWIFTGGTNTGVTRQVGDALLLERSQRSGRVVSIGIAPWGIVENNHELCGHNRDVPYHSISSPRSKYAVLNNRHAYFLLVDNGTSGRYGAELILRRKLEKYISIQKLHPGTHCSTPVVCLVIEGGTNTIRAVLEYVTDTPPVPVVVCDGSGRAADLLAFTHKYASESGEQTVLESMKDYLITTIQRTFEVGGEQAECLYSELLQCTLKKNLITVFRITDRPEETSQELDQTILTALFKSQHLSPSEQLSLALTWNRVDIARSEIFVYGQEWPPGALDEAMMQALEHDRIDFVKLLLENGVHMKKFLSIPRLEELYNTKQGPSNTLGYILRDVRPHIPRGYVYTLHDIGLVINKLMGGAYRSYYTRRKFRLIYSKVMKKSPHVHRNSSSFIRYCGNTNVTLSLLAETLPTSKETAVFDYPFNELLTWAVLTRRQQMALLMWQRGEEALAKALVACKLYKAMAHEAAEDDLETQIYEELRNYGKEFENIALELLDFCYRQHDDQTQQLLTCELQNWSGQTCLSLAVAANHRALLAHPCSQIILADLWMGGLRTRKNTNLKVILGLLCPFYIAKLEFKSKEELQLMPQTEEEHLIGLEEENESIEGQPTDTNCNLEPDAEALISHENYAMRNTVVQENGKVVTECDDMNQHFHFPLDYFEVKNNRPLRLRKKLYEFYTAPITKFWGHSIAYIVFLVTFTYVVLVKMDMKPSWQELYTIAYICTLAFEKVREIVSSEPVAVSHKLSVWAWNMWNPCDAAAIIFFLIGLCLRLRLSSMQVGRLIFCVDIVYWYLRILKILGVNKYLGPLVTMMGKMVKDMIYFVVLLLVVLMSFGVCRQAILNPDKEPSWSLVRDIFFKPYFMLYGEVFADSIDPPCGDDPGLEKCQMGRWITAVEMAVYLLVANILLINLLIAVFNNIFNEVNAISHEVWMFQRFTVVMEYEEKPVLPPPLIVLCHVFLLLKYCHRKVRGVRELYDNALKLFLDHEDLERLYDFEEECVEGYFREQETKLHVSNDECIRNTADRVDNMYQKIEDINQKENKLNSALQGVEFRMRKLEDLTDQTLSHLAVIHRFMATHVQDPLPMSDLPDVRLGTERIRLSSDRSDDQKALSETSDHAEKVHLLPMLSRDRRRPTRSLTEVRPDSFLLGESFHVRLDDDVQTTDKFIPMFEKAEQEGEEEKEEDGEISDLSHTIRKRIPHQLTKQMSMSRNSLSDPVESHSGSNLEGTADIGNNEDNTQSRILFRGNSSDYRSERRESSASSNRKHSLEIGEDSEKGSVMQRPPALTRRQISKTHSEPENATGPNLQDENEIPRVAVVERSVTWAEPRITVIPPSIRTNPRAMLLAMHSEYTSITDELETVCGLLSPPHTPRLLSPPRPGENLPRRTRHTSEMSNPEMALFLEKEHLRDAEENDYQLMETLMHQHMGQHEEDAAECSAFFLNVTNETPEFRSRSLHRSSAIEVKDFPTPCTHGPPAIFCTDADSQQLQIICTESGLEEVSGSGADALSLMPTSETTC
ncbi:transient receptor potential cation channel trpm isoform X2 [Cryptotermes secundus]|uniref:transient receptor potential cation channel trpm isoform X2 n=1 Tax=Cryptotermes secundus TaxID=105785 RepID=UPI001454C7FE|nr:transient receptor potential cation channel trpm isoform X2 [Cryptotermes secundus]